MSGLSLSGDFENEGSGHRDEDARLGLFRWQWRGQEASLVCSQALAGFLGEPPDQPVTWDLWLRHVHPLDVMAVRKSLEPSSQRSRSLTYRIQHPDGRISWIEDRRHRLADGAWSGVFIQFQGTSRSTAEAQETQYRISRVMTAAGIGIVFRDFQSGDEFCNETLFSILGLDKAASYQDLANLIHPEDAPVFKRMVASQRRNGLSFDLDYRIITPRGELRWLREQGQYERAPDGALLRYYAAIRDVTAERRRASELNASRMRLKLALEFNAVAVWEVNSATGQPNWSDEYYRLLGYEPRSVPPGRAAWLAAVHPEDRGFASDKMEEMFVSGEGSDLTYRIIANGRERWVRDTWSWGRASTGEALVCYGLTADITDSKLKESRLITAENWLKLAVEAAGLGIWEHAIGNGEYQWNDQMFQLLGHAPGEIEPSSQSWNERIHPDDLPLVLSELAVARTGLSDFNLKYRLVMPDGGIRWVEERGRITYQASVARHHGVMFDVSSSKALELRLLESRERLQLALDTGEMGFWSGEDSEQNWDERTYRILGVDPLLVAATYENTIRLVHPDDRDYVIATNERARASGEVVTAEFRIIRPDGAVRWVESRFCIAGSLPFGPYGIIRDITDRKSREEYYLRSQRLEAAGQLLGGMVHDFNNLLAVIAATLERLERHSTTPEMAKQLAQAREAAHAGGLFNRRLINLSQLRRQQPQPVWISERVNAIMGALTSVMKPGIRVSCHFPEDLWPVMVDALDLESAIINLVINARDAIDKDGDIVIAAHNHVSLSDEPMKAKPSGDCVVLTIRDTGCGMDRATRERALEPFFSTKPEGAGTGLGLTSVAAFVAGARGHLNIDSAPGHGTTISLVLPRAHVQRPDARDVGESLPMGDGECVLVVDDDPAVRESTLQRVEALGYAVDEAANAGEAIGKILMNPAIALVLSDIAMPGDLNGFGLRDWISLECPDLPVVLISAHEHFLRDGSGSRSGGEVLSKTCSREALAHALARRRTAPPP